MNTTLLARSGTRLSRLPVLRASQVSKEYRLGRERVAALSSASLEVHTGDFIALSGPSGSGKTTLLNLLGLLEQPSSGHVYLRGRRTNGMSRSALAGMRAREIGFVFQNFNLIPVLNAIENVEYPLTLRGLSGRDRRQSAEEALEAVGLFERRNHRPAELSGGQQQRVAVARAMVTSPAVVLADEPTANLDRRTGEEVLQLMQRLNEEHGTAFVFSTHDPRVVALAQRVVYMSDGRIVEEP